MNIVVRAFDAATAGTQLYSESHNAVTIDEGVFTLELGAGATPAGTFDAATFANNNIWLELEIGGEAQVPRQAFLSVPYALVSESADNAAQLDGVPAADYALDTDVD